MASQPPTTPDPLPTQPVGRADLAWLPRGRHVWQRYGAAIVLTLLAIWLRMALAPADTGGRFVTASLAVALSAFYGGFGPGLLSTLLGMVLVNFFMIEPYMSLAIDDPGEAFWLNFWHLLTQLVVISSISLVMRQNQGLREAQNLARLSQQRFLDTFEHAASGITHVDTGGRLIRTNQTFCDMVGYSQDELAQLRFHDITHPDDLAPDVTLLQQTLSGQRTSYTLEKRYRHKDGHTVWAQLTVALVRHASGEPAYFISVAQDISNQKAAEAALKTSENLLQQAQKLARLTSWRADLVQDRFVPLNGSEPLPGHPLGVCTGAELLSFTHPDDQAGLRDRWQSAIKNRRPYEHEYRLLIQGEERWYSAQARFEYDSNGRAVSALGVTFDITDRKLAELEVQRLNTSLEQRIQERTRELRAAYDDLESYSYAVAHDLRSPLRIINGFAQALQEEHPAIGDPGTGYLSRIMAASKKMGELIDGLLKLSQYTQGELNRVSVNLSAVATRQLEELASSEPERRVQWSVEPGMEVHADPALIDALMQNLLHNAWKYTAGVPEAQVQVFARVWNGERHFCVIDNGAGFDMARADKLFQPFQRLHQPHEFAGLGIGLATSRRIVQRHGGTMQAKGMPGHGATFCFTLPNGVE